MSRKCLLDCSANGAKWADDVQALSLDYRRKRLISAMKKIFLILLAVCTVVGIAVAGVITRDGELVTPLGEGTVTLDAGTFEAFPLPQYAAKHLTDGYKSYFVEVEPGIKVHVLEVGAL